MRLKFALRSLERSSSCVGVMNVSFACERRELEVKDARKYPSAIMLITVLNMSGLGSVWS